MKSKKSKKGLHIVSSMATNNTGGSLASSRKVFHVKNELGEFCFMKVSKKAALKYIELNAE